MSEISITNRILGALQPKAKPYFLRDNNPKGFGVKVNPSGKIIFIAVAWHKGATGRKLWQHASSFRWQRQGGIGGHPSHSLEYGSVVNAL